MTWREWLYLALSFILPIRVSPLPPSRREGVYIHTPLKGGVRGGNNPEGNDVASETWSKR